MLEILASNKVSTEATWKEVGVQTIAASKEEEDKAPGKEE
jgi:hypothetical protein